MDIRERGPDLPREPQETHVEPYLREALIRLNPDIAANPSRVDDVLYRLRAIIMGVLSDGLVKANESSRRGHKASAPCPTARTASMSLSA